MGQTVANRYEHSCDVVTSSMLQASDELVAIYQTSLCSSKPCIARRSRPRCVSLCVIVLVFFACSLVETNTATAQDRSPFGTFSVLAADNISRLAGHGVTDESCSAAPELMAVLAAIADVEKSASAYSARATMGLKGDEAPVIQGSDGPNAGTRSRSDVNIGISLEGGSYPSQLSFSSSIGVLYQNGQFDENVSTVHLSVDHYVTPTVQPYAFVHRRSDNYMSIDQRYEVGGGVVLDWHPLGYGREGLQEAKRMKMAFTKAGRDGIDGLGGPGGSTALYYDGNNLPAWAECYRKLNKLDDSPATTRKIQDAIDSMADRWKEALDATRKKYTRLRLGLLAGVFYELESSTINTGDAVLTAPGDRIYRVEFRPTVKFRVVDWLVLRGDYYYKKSLSDPLTRISGAEADYRSNMSLSLVISQFGGSRNGGINTSTSLTYSRYYDNQPPQVGDVIARRRHSTFGLAVAVGL